MLKHPAFLTDGIQCEFKMIMKSCNLNKFCQFTPISFNFALFPLICFYKNKSILPPPPLTTTIQKRKKG